MNSKFTASSPPASVNLTTLAVVKNELGITTSDDDAYLSKQITALSQFVATYLGVRPTDDGARGLGQQELTETFDLTKRARTLRLSRWPLTAVASVTEDGTDLAADDYELDAPAGLLRRLCNDSLVAWNTGQVTVEYTAGYVLPGESGRTLPYDIEDAVLDLIKADRAARNRDPALRSEEIVGVVTRQWWNGTTLRPGELIPPEVARNLDAYREVSIGALNARLWMTPWRAPGPISSSGGCQACRRSRRR